MQAGAERIVEHIFIGFVIRVVAGQLTNQLERHIGADTPVGSLTPCAVGVFYAFTNARCIVFLFNDDVTFSRHLQQCGVHGITLARGGNVNQQVITGIQHHVGGFLCGDSNSSIRQVLGGNIGKRLGDSTLILFLCHNSSHICGSVASGKNVLVASSETRVRFQRWQKFSTLDAVTPLDIPQSWFTFGTLCTAKDLVGLVGVVCSIIHSVRRSGNHQCQRHDERQQ